MIAGFCLSISLGWWPVAAEEPIVELRPLMAVPANVVYQSDFSKAGSLKKSEWQPRQGTRWTVADGVLRGLPSSPEYQASRKDHKGLEPRVAAPMTPSQFIARLSVRFRDGEETPIVPFVEFGHHKVRLRFSKTGLTLLADYESLKLAEDRKLKYEAGRWYHLLAEAKGDEFVVQFEKGPTLYARHASLSQPVTSGADGLGVAGPRNGVAELDNVTLWNIQEQPNPQWEKTRATLATFPPEVVKSKKQRAP